MAATQPEPSIQQSPGIEPRRTGRIARRIARGLGTLFAAYILLMLIAHAVVGIVDDEPLAATGVGVGILSSWLAASLLAGWWWEKLGGISCVASGIVLGVFVFFTAGRNEVPVALALGTPIVAVGAAFLIANRGRAGASVLK